VETTTGKQPTNRQHQCNFRSTKHAQDITLVPCGSWLPPERNVHRCRPRRQLLNVASPHRQHGTPPFPRLHGNIKGASQGTAAGHTFHEAKGIRKIGQDGGGPDQTGARGLTSHHNHPTQRYLHLHRGPQQQDPLRPDRRIPIHLSTRQLIHHGGNTPGCQLYFCRANEK